MALGSQDRDRKNGGIRSRAVQEPNGNPSPRANLIVLACNFVDNSDEIHVSCSQHPAHSHVHGEGCGHLAVKHQGHVDYLHDGHLHHPHSDHVDEHSLSIDDANPVGCTPDHQCGAHDAGHRHGAGCGHEAVPHGDHIDYLVDGHLHHTHGGHCDDHGRVDQA